MESHDWRYVFTSTFEEFDARVTQAGWEEVADYALAWAEADAKHPAAAPLPSGLPLPCRVHRITRR